MEKKTDFSEKRKHPRHSVSNAYSLELSGTHYQGKIGNLSLGGVFLETISPQITDNNMFQNCTLSMLLLGTELSLPCSISFIASENSQLRGGVGIAFATLSDHALATLENYIEEIQSSTAPDSYALK